MCFHVLLGSWDGAPYWPLRALAEDWGIAAAQHTGKDSPVAYECSKLDHQYCTIYSRIWLVCYDLAVNWVPYSGSRIYDIILLIVCFKDNLRSIRFTKKLPVVLVFLSRFVLPKTDSRSSPSPNTQQLLIENGQLSPCVDSFISTISPWVQGGK